MTEPSFRSSPASAVETPYDVRGGAAQLFAELRRAPGGWLLPSTWRASVNLLLWLATSYAMALVALVGGLASLVTASISGVGVAVRGSVMRALAELIAVDRQRLERFSGVGLEPLAPPATEPGASPAEHQLAWAQSPLRRRLPVDALIRTVVSSAAGAAVAAWWWVTIVCLTMAIWRFTGDHGYYEGYRHIHILGEVFRVNSVSLPGAIVRAVIGIAGLLLWPAVPRAALALDVAVARPLAAWLQGLSTSELSREVDRLSETRAQAVTAADAERRRIERDLHDGFQPQLVNLALNLGLAKSRMATDPEGAAALLDRAHEDAKRATEDLRSLVRGIHPSVLDERGLDAAFSALAASSRVRVQIDVHLHERPPREAEGIAYFVVAEAVTNVNKHAHADTVTVTISKIEGSLRVLVQDNGQGGAQAEPGGGLAGLADRIAGVDGTFSITSPGGGPTWIEARIPCGR